MKRGTVLLFAALFTASIHSATIQYTKSDSVKVVRLLAAARNLPADSNVVIHFARQFIGIPYVAQTLEKNKQERLVINLRQLDCTTYVENVMALALCIKNKKHTFHDFCKYLQSLRYRNGQVGYVTRLHYFTDWINDNTQLGYVKELQSPCPPFCKTQLINVNYMSRYPSKYPMLVAHPSWVTSISAMEKRLNGMRRLYIPKATIRNNTVFRNAIHDGDIIAITTSKAGLETSHIGIAVWHQDGLHMLNASMLRHKVVEETLTLYDYMRRQKTQTGIRIVRPMMLM